MSGFDPRPALKGLKDFQRRTVDYVFRRLYEDADPTSRFLVADEVGLGKTHVARGVVARVLDHLKDQDRVTVVYVCSNGAIARQNLNRLNVLDDVKLARASRVTLLPKELPDLHANRVNFIAFTPGTSFDLASRSGRVDERAMIFHLLQQPWNLRLSPGVCNLLAAGAKPETIEWAIRDLRENGQVSEFLADRFRAAVAEHPGLREEFDDLRDRYRAGPKADAATAGRRTAWVGEVRGLLARTCLDALRPDLIILDEFQRFKDLLRDDPEADETTTVPAHDFFNAPNAKILLLSATPYKMYTLAREGDDDHFRDFRATVGFLLNDPARLAALEHTLTAYRRELFRLDAGSLARLRGLRGDLEGRLRGVVARTERPAGGPGTTECKDSPFVRIEAPDLAAYLAVQTVARELALPDVAEFWKAAPYLLNFMEGYQLPEALKEARGTPQEAALARALGRRSPALLDWRGVGKYAAVDPGNARLRGLLADTVDRGWWQLLWVPPALPYYQPAGVFAIPGADKVTKRLVFSAWRVVPKAVAALVSYAAEREMMRISESAPVNTPEARTARRPLLRFSYSKKAGRLTGMPVLALLYPSPVLAAAGDPLAVAAAAADLLTADELVERVRARLEPGIATLVRDRGRPGGRPDKAWYWAAPVLLDAAADPDATRAWLDNPELAHRWAGGRSDKHRESRYWPKHLEEAARVLDPQYALGPPPPDLARVLARLAVAGPGTCLLRALTRGETGPHDPGVRTAAAAAAWPFVGLFNAPEVIAMLGGRTKKGSYWKKVLRYALNGGLQAVLDDYLHQVREDHPAADPAEAAWAAAERTREALSVRTSSLGVTRVRARPAAGTVETEEGKMRARFAMRFGDEKDDAGGETRADQVRAAFNGPFWPFVLATTSVGQEGLDFHPYCHAVVHWTLPANPVDLEQREGRVNRYKNHAVRKNLAAEYSHVGLAPDVGDPWQAMFEAARTGRGSGKFDLEPYWVFNRECGAVVERHVPAVPLSRDVDRYADLQRSLAVYRLAFGQSGQEDLLAFLRAHCPADQLDALSRGLRIDLRPPGSH